MDVAEFLSNLSVKLEPLGDRVAIFLDSEEQMSEGGIIIPDTTEKEPQQSGTVVAYGNGHLGKDCPLPSDFLKKGDRVLFGKFTGDDLKIKKKDGTQVKVKILHLDAILSGCNPQ